MILAARSTALSNSVFFLAIAIPDSTKITARDVRGKLEGFRAERKATASGL